MAPFLRMPFVYFSPVMETYPAKKSHDFPQITHDSMTADLMSKNAPVKMHNQSNGPM